MEASLENIPSTDLWRLSEDFDKIEFIFCNNCKINIQKHGKFCPLCTHSTTDNPVHTVYVEKTK